MNARPDMFFIEDAEAGSSVADETLSTLYSKNPSEVELLSAMDDSELDTIYLQLREALAQATPSLETIKELINANRDRLNVLLAQAMESEIARITLPDLIKDTLMALAMKWPQFKQAPKTAIRNLPQMAIGFIMNGLKASMARINKVETAHELSTRMVDALSFFSRRYVGPNNIDDNVREFQHNYPEWGATFALELENAADLEEGSENLERILAGMRRLAEIYREDPDAFPGPQPQISIKLSGWGTVRFHEKDSEENRATRAGLAKILDQARQDNVFAMIDAERLFHRDEAHQIVMDAFSENPENFPHLGIVIQTYSTNSLDKTVELVELAKRMGKPLKQLRIVKGAYHEQEQMQEEEEGRPKGSIVYEHQHETDRNYLRTIEYMFQNPEQWETLAFGTMNKDTACAVMELVIRYNIPLDRVESQQLKGMVDQLGWGLGKLGFKRRTKYVPWGEQHETALYGNRRLVESPKQFEMLKRLLGGPIQLPARWIAAKTHHAITSAIHRNSKRHALLLSR